jgi:alanine-synthesizing transaminase
LSARFSGRVPWPARSNALAVLRERLLRSGEPILDFSDSNPTRTGLTADCGRGGDWPVGLLADPDNLCYLPDPRGLARSREALVAHYAASIGSRVTAPRRDDFFICSSTSEAYSWLFKLLCDPGDAVLVPKPGYPLFEYLAGLESVEARGYRLEYAHPAGWCVDLDSVRDAMRDGKVRALVVINPNNPTGSYIGSAERRVLAEHCAEGGCALIADEVFFGYRLEEPDLGDAGAHGAHCAHCAVGAIGEGSSAIGEGSSAEGSGSGAVGRGAGAVGRGAGAVGRDAGAVGRDAGAVGARAESFAGEASCLTFVLDGLSKLLGLPQLKLGWIACSGPRRELAEAEGRLEIIADSYLSAGTPPMNALGALLGDAEAFVTRARERIAGNLQALRFALEGADSPHRVLRCDGGWTAIIESPRLAPEEELAAGLLRDARIWTQPGYFFDMEREAFFTVSLILRPGVLAEGAARYARYFEVLMGR